MSRNRRYINVFIICCSLLIWNMPYMTSMFYEQFQKAYQLSNTQIGLLITMFGLTAVPGYTIGGFVADKFSCRKLVALSCACTAALGLVVAFTDSYTVLIICYLGYGVTVPLMQWASFTKLTLAQAEGSEEHGRIMGFFELSACIINVVFAYGILAFLGKIIEKTGFAGVMYAFAAILVLSAILIMVFIKEPEKGESTNSFNVKMIPMVLKHPGTWFQAMIVLGSYMMTNAATYMNPYLTQVLGASTTLGVGFAIFARYGRNAVAVFGGQVKDRTGKSSTVIYIFDGIALIATIALILVPQDPKYKVLAVVIMSAAILFSGCARPCLYTPAPECGVPQVYLGTAIGIASAIGYSGDLWYYTLCGKILDTQGAAGYKWVFTIIALGLVLVLVTAMIMQRWLDKKAALEKEDEKMEA